LVDAAFHLRPQYRQATPLDATLLKVRAGSDEFVTEKYHERIAATLTSWSYGLRASPPNSDAIRRSLAAGFAGSPLGSSQSQILRPGPALEVLRIRYAQQRSIGADAFLRQFRSLLSVYSMVSVAEFQVTALDSDASGLLRTRIRYELVGSGEGFHKEQRAGYWNLEWETAPGDQYRVSRWMAESETRARTVNRWYEDVAENAFGRNRFWSAQMLHGVDYWRSVLDGASGIDIYGHNGVSVGDIDGDGFDDIYICQPAGLPNRLYRNRGDGTFEDITEASGVGLLDNTSCALFADFDNDGRQDLIVVRATGPLLFLNRGGGKFSAKPDAFQFASPPRGTFTGAAVADYDRDGWLDVYFCLYTYYQGTDQYNYPVPYYAAENGPPNFLMRNNRDGTFRDATAESGLGRNNTRFSFCCAWGDYNRDGWPDLYVVNDFGLKNLYRNNGDGTFTDLAAQAGVEDAGAGMSACWFDYDNDGAEDLYAGNMWTAAGERISAQPGFQRQAPEPVRALYRKHAMGNSLFRNQGTGTFENKTTFDGAGMGRWSWSSDAWDFDHDGFDDLYIANGMVSGPRREDLNSFFWRQVVANSPNAARSSPEYEQGWNAVNELIRSDYAWSGYERNVFYANNRDGTFVDVSGAVDLDFIEDGRSFALADFDNDGRLEILLKSRNAPQVRLLKNVLAELPPSITFRLRGGAKSNRDAIGAVVTIDTEAGRQMRRVQAGSGFLSQHSKELHFGVGRGTGPITATIEWPSGAVQHLRDLPANHRISVDEGDENPRFEAFKTQALKKTAALPASAADVLPSTIETWLLAPVPAPDFSLSDSSGRVYSLAGLRGKPALLTLSAAASGISRSLPSLNVVFSDGEFKGSFPNLRGTNDVAAIYNILYRQLFDRRRDLTLPTSFLINENGEIVRVYQGAVRPGQAEQDASQIPQTAAQRLALALPFHGNAETYAFGRNHLSLGSIFFQRGYLDQSETFFHLALRDDAASAEAHYGLGSIYLRQDKNAEARASFEQAVRLTASYADTGPNAWNNLGLLATREGRIDDAIANFNQAVRVSPDYWIALENLGNAYRQQRRWAEARAALDRALAVRPGSPEANYGLAMVLAQTDDTQGAEEHLKRALDLRPGYPEALNNLGILYLRTQRRDDAVAKFDECIRVAPAFDQSYLNLARLYSFEGATAKARGVLVELLRQVPNHPQARQLLDQLR
jgi:tetratricopeptide (TPR) repeat protein